MLELRNVTKHYRSGGEVVRALDGVSLTVDPGEMVALYGPSGSGKTTLLLIAAGLTPPDAGEVLVGGHPISGMSDGEATRYRRSQLGFVFQQFHLVPHLSAIDNAATKVLAEGAGRRRARAQAAPWLHRVGLDHRAKQPPERLSTGERQRVAIARALANEPPLVLADEPTGNLDSKRGAETLAMLAAISHDEGVAILLVTHDPQAAAFANRTLTLRDGLLFAGAPPRPPESPPPAAPTPAGAR